ncbi:MAG: tRNA nucleotidyltransferase [Oscillospiraceae bacterium]|nr:tRNA nucleotidyltransferase [Oscillospiraceae bacterium]
MELPFQICEILERLESAGYSAYVVGGCVRDWEMGITPHDFDITTAALPREVERVFADCRVIETGIEHGTVTVLYKGIGVEITTFRVDGEYADSRHPSSVSFSARIEDDLARRDFTMNAIAFSPRRGTVDPFGGREDIGRGVIRCVGEPRQRFSEDALRILRALRFASVCGFAVDGTTSEAARNLRVNLHRVSAERIFSELKRLLCGESVKQVMLSFPEIFAEIIPPIGLQIRYDQNSRFHDSTLYEHTARAVESAPPNPVMRLAMLFHDTGKPFCRSTDEDGESHYYGHAERSAQIAEEQLRILKCDNETRLRVVEIVRFHDLPLQDGERFINRQLAKHGAVLSDIISAHIADDSAKIPEARERIPRWQEILALTEEIAAQHPCLTTRDLAIGGRDLMELMPPSPRMGEILRSLLAEVIDGILPNEREPLLIRARELANNL